MNTNIVEIKVKNQSIIRTRPLYQWDSGQILKVIDQGIPDNTEVQFGSACLQPSVPAFMVGNQVKIPQAAMDQAMEITAYMVIVEPDSETTVKEIRIPIKPKPKPSDYVPEEDVPSIMQVIQGKADKGGWTPNMYLGTDAEGNMVEKDAPSGGGGGATAEQLEQIETNKQNIESLSKDFSGKADKATTLAGYGITDGATKSDVSQLSGEIANQQAQIDAKQPKGNYLTTETDPTVPAWAKADNKPTYTAEEVGARPSTWTPSASEVGAEPAGTAAGTVSSHNTAEDAHSDIRLLVAGLTARLNALADSDDETLDQVSELVAYIKANRELIEQVTTGKVSVSDIVDNLTTNVSNKPLSAAQGVALKAIIDGITVPTKVSQLENDSGYLKEHQDLTPYAKTTDLTAHTGNSTVHVTAEERAKWNGKSNFSGSYTDLTNKPTIPSKTSDLENDSGYITNAPVTSVNGKTGAVTLSASDVGALPSSTQIPSISGLATETYVNNKVAGIVNSAPGTLDTLNELATALGNDPKFATTVATQIGNKVDKIEGKGLSTNDYTTEEKNKLAGIAEGANNYTHPYSHPATMITEDATHRFVTDNEKAAWNENALPSVSPSDSGKILMVNSSGVPAWTTITNAEGVSY